MSSTRTPSGSARNRRSMPGLARVSSMTVAPHSTRCAVGGVEVVDVERQVGEAELVAACRRRPADAGLDEVQQLDLHGVVLDELRHDPHRPGHLEAALEARARRRCRARSPRPSRSPDRRRRTATTDRGRSRTARRATAGSPPSAIALPCAGPTDLTVRQKHASVAAPAPRPDAAEVELTMQRSPAWRTTRSSSGPCCSRWSSPRRATRSSTTAGTSTTTSTRAAWSARGSSPATGSSPPGA